MDRREIQEVPQEPPYGKAENRNLQELYFRDMKKVTLLLWREI
jgi:hypothetical protein